ncbi:hypothetical protein DHEL01_v211175 [Diaporthe helianthi]|uniref:Uncharacterized protein n=1 Tax=Diaporthe helianthi TaxID=158607 RepID=A0A2P5HJK3_DIAHE|nr:hypothetical protein DHEL01_v211175 [Diaporthe helianthi]
MKRRSAKAAQRRGSTFSLNYEDKSPHTISEASRSRKRKGSVTESLREERRRRRAKQTDPDPDELEEERANPTKVDYNHVRKALILARADASRKADALEQKDAALEELTREVGERDRIIKDKEYLLLKCSEIYDHIRMVEGTGLTPRLIGHGLGGRGHHAGSVPPNARDVSYPEPTESVKNMLVKLRTSIRDFANKYFSGKLQTPSMAQLGIGPAQQYMQATTPGEETYMDYLLSRHRCPMIIEAFIWRFICGAVFNTIPWGGNEEIRHHLSGLQNLLAQFHNSSESDPEKMKAYNLWRKQTTELVLQIHHANTAPADLHLSKVEESYATAISKTIVTVMRSSPAGHKEELGNIIREAIALDMEMSRQLARYTWRFSNKPADKPCHFRLGRENVMTLHSEEKTISKLTGTMKKKARVHLVVAPGLTQRGQDNSPSTSFKDEYWAVPMDVTCVKPKRQENFSSPNGGSEATVQVE